VKKYHLDSAHEVPATYSVANFLQDPNYIQQGFVTSEPYFARRAGVSTRMLMNSDAGYDPYRVFYTSSDFLRDHPDVVAKFVRASVRGWRDYMVDPTAANAEIVKLNPALSKDWMEYSYAALKKGGYIEGSDATGALVGKFDATRWQSMYSQLLELQVLKKPVDVRSAYTTQFLD
jgi:NitT/TauT family transport system substrate-binding protein